MALHVLACICIVLLRINRYYVSTANFWSYRMSARNTNCQQLMKELNLNLIAKAKLKMMKIIWKWAIIVVYQKINLLIK